MNRRFDFEQLADHDLYHLRCGEGALIVAVEREDVESSRPGRAGIRQDIFIEASERNKSIDQNLLELRKMRNCTHPVAGPGGCEAPVEVEALPLENEPESISYRNGPFFPGPRVAHFGARNLARKSDMNVEFDKITSISESRGQVVIGLEFNRQSIRDRIDHLKPGVHDLRHVHAIEGRATRIVPVDNIKLEIIGKNRRDAAPGNHERFPGF